MAAETTNYSLIKPAQSDFYNVGDFNKNADVLDEEMKKREDAISEINKILGDTDISELVTPTITALAKYLQGVGEGARISSAGFHNSFFRGKNLGTQLTAAQSAAIRAGTFDDIFVGDYWTISGVNYRVAACDYYYRSGDTDCTTHHIVVVPDSNLYTAAMNDTNITTGAYVGSKMYTTNLAQAKSTAQTAFGTAHLLTHRIYLQNAMTNGYPSAGAWYNSYLDLMTESMVYGGPQYRPMTAWASGTNVVIPNQYSIECKQLPLFTLRPDLISNRQWYWLREALGDGYFANVGHFGHSNYDAASNSDGVRPAIAVY